MVTRLEYRFRRHEAHSKNYLAQFTLLIYLLTTFRRILYVEPVYMQKCSMGIDFTNSNVTKRVCTKQLVLFSMRHLQILAI